VNFAGEEFFSVYFWSSGANFKAACREGSSCRFAEDIKLTARLLEAEIPCGRWAMR